MEFRTRVTAGRVIAAFMILVAGIVLVQVALGDADMFAAASAVVALAIFGWWFHLWGWRGDPPPGARNRLPWQR